MHAFEKFVADKFGDGNAEQRFSRRRSENDRAALAATDNNVRHVPDQKPIAILLCAEQLGVCANERRGTKPKTRRIEQR